MLLVTSCVTIKTEYQYVMPDYVLPEFPVCPGYIIMDDEEWTLVSSDWFIQVAKFKNEYKEFCLWYEKSKEVLKEVD